MSHGHGRQARQPDRTDASQPTGNVRYPRGAGAYPQDLVPVALAGDYVRLEPHGDVYQVDVVQPQPGIDAFNSDQSNGVTASSQDTTSDQHATELEQRDRWLGQMRMVNISDIPSGIEEVQVDQGGGRQPLWTSKDGRGYVDNPGTQALLGYSGVTEFYVWQDEAPKFSFVNNTASNITINDVQFAGYHLRLDGPTNVPSNVQEVALPVQPVDSTSSR